MSDHENRARTLQLLRERRERLASELASLESSSPGLTARELLTWQTRLAELESRIERYAHG